MADPKVVQLIERLRSSTAKGTSTWSKTVEKETFNLSFKDYSVQLAPRWAQDEYGNEYSEVVFRIYDSEGELIEEVGPNGFSYQDFDLSPSDVLDELHNTARRQAMGMNKAVQSILDQLPELPKVAAPKSPEPEDDIPF